MNAMAQHDIKALLATFAPSAKVHLEDGFQCEAQTFCTVHMIPLWESFPDFAFEYDSNLVVEGDKIHVEKVHAIGTHTGAPYSLGLKYPAIEAQGKSIRTDEESFVFHFEQVEGSGKWKIREFVVISFGSLTGPAGTYELIGGKL